MEKHMLSKANSGGHIVLLFAATLLLFFPPHAATAQQIHYAAQPGPYYVGEPVVVQIVVRGVDGKTKVDCRLKDPAPANLAVQGPEMSQSSRSFTQIINGRMTSSESIDYRFQFVVTASQEGKYMVGPFLVIVDGHEREVAGSEFEFGKLANDPDMRIEVSMPSDTVYVGQEVPVTIRWSFTGEMQVVQYAFANLQIRSPLFDQFPFRDVPSQTRTALTIATAKGSVEVDAKVTQEKIDGREFVVVTATRTMVPDTPGTFTDIPVTCRTQRVTSWRRDFFGDVTPGRSAPAMAAGEPVSLTVRPIPQAGRPPSFAGAVGRGFSIEAAANRSIVRVGDPISLNITVHGDGNLSRISLPPLNRNEGLDSSRFQVPSDPPPGKVDGNAKQFNLTVRVKNQSVEQIPPIAFSWFDPYQEQFDTAVTKPIALQVMETQVVSANDVITAQSNTAAAGEDGGDGQTQDSASEATGSFVGANLAITTDPMQLLTSSSVWHLSRLLTISCYSLAVLLIVGSVVLRKRQNRDQAEISRKKRLRQLTQQLQRAGQLPTKEAAERVARLLRELLAEFEVKNRSEIDALIARCDNMIYATGDAAAADAAELADKAVELARSSTFAPP